MRPLLPTLKEKTRYVAFLTEGGEFDQDSIKRAISGRLIEVLGALGLAEADFRVVGNCWQGNKGIIACNAKGLASIKGALAFVNRINGRNAAIRLLGVSGTIKKCKERFF